MTGIFGIIGAFSEKDLKCMSQRLFHRGTKINRLHINEEVLFANLSKPDSNSIYHHQGLAPGRAKTIHN